MKKFLSVLLFALLCISLAACASNTNNAGNAGNGGSNAGDANSTGDGGNAGDAGEAVELIVFAAASMQETMEEIAELYKEAAPNVTITYNFDSSGTLKTQIQEGADCDIFISAAPKQMNQLDANGGEENTEGLDFVLSDTPPGPAGEQGDPGRPRGEPGGDRVL